jgi:LacI family transcriptional regulator
VEFCRQWIIGVREAFDTQGASVSVITAEPNVSNDPMFQRGLKEGDYDGLISMGVYENHGYVEAAVDAGVRVVAMNRTSSSGRYSTVSEDHYGAGRMAAKYLLERGHRKFACGYLLSSRVPARRQGFDDELRAWDAPAALDLHLPDNFEDIDAFRNAAQEALKAGCTACFSGDPAAYRIADSLIDLGQDVPDKISVLGADNRGFKTSTGRRLTSLATNSKVMGQLAAEILQHLLAIGPDIINMTATVPCRIAEGETVAKIDS